MKDSMITFRVPKELKKDLQNKAQSEGLSMGEYLVRELSFLCHFINCPLCNTPVANKRYLSIIAEKEVKLKCPNCSNVWTHQL